MHRMPRGIASGRRSPRGWFPALAVALALATPVSADVLVKQKTVSEGFGGFGGTTNATVMIAGDKSRTDDEGTSSGPTSGMAGAKPNRRVSITRLDKEVLWWLDSDKKQYSETTFAQLKAVSEKEPPRGKPGEPDLSFTVEVEKTGVHQEVNGYPCEEVVVTCVGEPTQAGKAGELFGKKAARAASKKVEDKASTGAVQAGGGTQAPVPAGMRPGSSPMGSAGGPLFKVVTDVVSISTTSAPAGSFDIPAGYKKKD